MTDTIGSDKEAFVRSRGCASEPARSRRCRPVLWRKRRNDLGQEECISAFGRRPKSTPSYWYSFALASATRSSALMRSSE